MSESTKSTGQPELRRTLHDIINDPEQRTNVMFKKVQNIIDTCPKELLSIVEDKYERLAVTPEFEPTIYSSDLDKKVYPGHSFALAANADKKGNPIDGPIYLVIDGNTRGYKPQFDSGVMPTSTMFPDNEGRDIDDKDIARIVDYIADQVRYAAHDRRVARRDKRRKKIIIGSIAGFLAAGGGTTLWILDAIHDSNAADVKAAADAMAAYDNLHVSLPNPIEFDLDGTKPVTIAVPQGSSYFTKPIPQGTGTIGESPRKVSVTAGECIDVTRFDNSGSFSAVTAAEDGIVIAEIDTDGTLMVCAAPDRSSHGDTKSGYTPPNYDVALQFTE